MAKKKVLIADDEAYIRLLVRSILGRDYVVIEAIDGERSSICLASRGLTLSWWIL